MNYKISTFIIACLILASFHCFSQDATSLVLTYERNFIRANSSTRIDIVKEAMNDERIKESRGALCEFVLNYALQYSEILKDDPELIAVTTLAVQGAGNSGAVHLNQTLWRVFMLFHDTQTRVAILNALASLGKGDSRIIENLNQFLANQNNVFRSGLTVDYQVLSASIDALGALGDGSSFPVLFSTMIAGYPEEYSQKAAKALGSIKGDYKRYLIDVIRKNPPAEKLAAFKVSLEHTNFTPADLGEIAEAALEISLGLFPADPGEMDAVQELRYAAVRTLTEQRWSRATTLAVKHFYRVQSDYTNGLVPKERFVEAINCLGAMGSSEAAQALALQLGLINSTMERTKEFDQEILEAVIDALGEIGDKLAFDYLLYISYLPYPASIQARARTALGRLKW